MSGVVAEVKDLDDGRGRGLYATTDCDAGTVLIEEAALVLDHVSPRADTAAACTRCSKALRSAQNVLSSTPFPSLPGVTIPVPQVIPCSRKGCSAQYCSESCRDSDQSLGGHQHICGDRAAKTRRYAAKHNQIFWMGAKAYCAVIAGGAPVLETCVARF